MASGAPTKTLILRNSTKQCRSEPAGKVGRYPVLEIGYSAHWKVDESVKRMKLLRAKRSR
jgi:hypothetical protein